MIKKLLIWLWITSLILWWQIFAQQNDFLIIPEAEDPSDVAEIVDNIGERWWQVSDRYNQQANEIDDIGTAFSSWVITRDTILDYVVYLIRFLSQLGLLIGAIMIIYAWYIYGTAVFNDNNVSKGKDAIGKAILWTIIIVFSYAIVRLLSSLIK